MFFYSLAVENDCIFHNRFNSELVTERYQCQFLTSLQSETSSRSAQFHFRVAIILSRVPVSLTEPHVLADSSSCMSLNQVGNSFALSVLLYNDSILLVCVKL